MFSGVGDRPLSLREFHKMYPSSRLACGVLVALLATLSTSAGAVELVRAGDADMSCQALTDEMNVLSSAKAKAAKRAESGRKLLGFASTALQIASSTGALGKGGVGGGQSGYIAQQAFGSLQTQLQTQALQQQMMAGAPGFSAFQADDGAAAPTGQAVDASVETQRLTRLTDLHAQKGC